MAEMSDSQQKRAQARQRRRKRAEDEPAQTDDGNATPTESSGGGEQPLQAVKQAAKVAAAGAAVGAAAAAARALSQHENHRTAEAGKDAKDESPVSQDEPVPAQAQEEPEPSAPEQGPDDDVAAEAVPETDTEPAPEQEEETEHTEPVAGAAPGETRKAVDSAKEQLESLLGQPVESVSSLERTHDGWVLVLEVVALARVPESTDVMASYELELDENLNLRRYQQVRRYVRSQSDGGEGS